MKIVIYDSQRIIDVIEGCEGVVVDGNNVTWQGGALEGINASFVVVDDSVDTSAVTPELIAADQSANLKPHRVIVDERLAALEQRVADLEQRIAALEARA